MSPKARVLALVTSAHRYEKTGQRTGLWLGELTDVYEVCKKAGIEVDVVSVDGGAVPLDPVSLMPPVLKLNGTDKLYEDPKFMAHLDETPSLRKVRVKDYDALYLPGGHGTMFDFTSQTVRDLVAEFADADKIIAAVCHGPVALLDVTLASGRPLLKGHEVTGYSWAEEKAAFRDQAVPFRLEDALKKQARKYTKARIPMGKKVVVDGPLITGQNPTSAKGVGEALVKALKKAARR